MTRTSYKLPARLIQGALGPTCYGRWPCSRAPLDQNRYSFLPLFGFTHILPHGLMDLFYGTVIVKSGPHLLFVTDYLCLNFECMLAKALSSPWC